jgi:hypothetical protein
MVEVDSGLPGFIHVSRKIIPCPALDVSGKRVYDNSVLL